MISAETLRQKRKEAEKLEIKNFLEPLEKRIISANLKGNSEVYYTEESEYKSNIIKKELEKLGYTVSQEAPPHPTIKRLCISWQWK